jgi:hypothetical protein
MIASVLKSKKSGPQTDDDVSELRQRSLTLQKELKEVNELLSKLSSTSTDDYESYVTDDNNSMKPSSTTISTILPPPGKSGYLFKWQDRSIGWGGTKWALRYVSLSRGRLSYFLNHLEASPRYVLSLRGCAIADEGKTRRQHVASLCFYC